MRRHGGRKRPIGLVLVLMILFGTFASEGIQAEAASVVAKGVDVSKYQGLIDWNAVAADGYSFAFIKAGSAMSSLDPYYAINMVGANAAGLRTGVYIYSYATTVEGAAAEAQFALLAMQGFTVNMPVVYDVETSAHKNMSTSELQALIVTFCSIIQSAGYYPMVYSYTNMLNEKIAASTLPYDVWAAQYGDSCDYAGASIWQYTSSGQVSGISGSVDLNYAFKDYSQILIPYGFTTRNGVTYFYNNYVMQFGMVEYEGKNYFMNADGSLYKSGWLTDGVNYFYMSTSDGHMLTDWVTISGNQYYFGTDGIMKTGLTTIDGQVYLFDATGVMQTGWYTDASGTRYFDSNGVMVMNEERTIDGTTYQFDANGLATEVVNLDIDLTGVDPSTWVYDAATGDMIDSATGEIVDEQIVAAVLAQAAAALGG